VALVIRPALVAPQLERTTQDAAVRARRDGRAAVGCPVPGIARGDSFRLMVPLGTYRLEHDVPAGKCNGELFPTAVQTKLRNGILPHTISAGVSRDLLLADENVQLKLRVNRRIEPENLRPAMEH
jgi:hypothetical protein